MCLIYFIAHNPRTKIDIPKGMYTIQKTKNKSYEKIRIKKWKNKKTPKHKKINKQATIQKLLNCTKRTEQEDQMRRQLDLVTAMFDWEKRLKKLAESYKVKIIYYQKIKRKGIMKEPKLEQIFWKDGKFVDKNNISVKIIPIGISRIFASMAANVIISKRGLEKNIDLETFEKNEIKKYLMEHEDKNYQKVNAYTKSVALEKENYYYISVNFYEKL